MDVGELRVVDHRLEVAGEREDGGGGGLLQRELEAVVEVAPAVVPVWCEEKV